MMPGEAPANGGEVRFTLSVKFLKGLSGDEIGRKAGELGFSSIELPIESGFPCPPECAAADLPRFAKSLRENHGVEIAVASVAANSDDVLNEALFGACAEAGIGFVSPAPFPLNGNDWWTGYEAAIQQLVRLEKFGRSCGAATLIPIDFGKSLVTTGSAAWVLAKACDPDFVSIRYDPADLVMSGEDYMMGLGVVQHYMGVVNATNCRYLDESKYLPAALDQGLVRWQDLAAALAEIDFDGILCFGAATGGEAATDGEAATGGMADAESRAVADRTYLSSLLSR